MGDKRNYYNKIYAPGLAHLIHEKDATIAERDAEIERLKDKLVEYAKHYTRAQLANEREAALMAFVEAFDGFYEAYCECVDSSDDLDKIDEAREQLKGVIGGVD